MNIYIRFIVIRYSFVLFLFYCDVPKDISIIDCLIVPLKGKSQGPSSNRLVFTLFSLVSFQGYIGHGDSVVRVITPFR